SHGFSSPLSDTFPPALLSPTFSLHPPPSTIFPYTTLFRSTNAVGPLASGDTKTIRILAQIKPGSTVSSISNTATVSAQSPTDPTAEEHTSTPQTPRARACRLLLAKTTTATANTGENVTYVI